MQRRALVLLLLAVAVHSYTANFKAWNFEGKPNSGGAKYPYVTGTISTNNGNVKIDYNIPAVGSQAAHTISTIYNTINLQDGTTQIIRRKHCTDSGKCLSDTINFLPSFDYDGTWVSTTVSGYSNCRRNPSSQIRAGIDPYYICKDGSNAITYIEIYNGGTRFELSNFNAAANPSIPAPGSCGNPTCNAQAEIVFVVDASGSIDSNEWNAQRTFIKNVSSSFDIKPTGVRVGFVYFGRNTYIVDLSGDRAAVLTQADSGRPTQIDTGWTNIDAGIRGSGSDKGAVQVLQRASSRNVPKIMILLTDGGCNYGSCALEAAQDAAANAGFTTFFAVGVDSALELELLRIAGCRPDVSTSWTTIAQCTAAGGKNGGKACYCPLKVTAFANLVSIKDQLISTTCSSLPPVTGNCNCFSGLCGCDGTFSDCRCPTCNDDSLCTTDTCTASTGLCTFAAKNIDDGNACTADSCNPATGVVSNELKTCAQLGFPDDSNICTQAVCEPSRGCFNNQTCTTQHAPLCQQWVCDVPSAGTFEQGCHLIPKDCGSCFEDNSCYDDNNPDDCLPKICPKAVCMDEYCDPNIDCDQSVNKTCNCRHKPRECTGTPCRPGRCDAATDSCVFDIHPCDDGNECTVDTCTVDETNSFSCTNTPITCDDHSHCTTDTCDPAVGCVYTPVVCEDESVCRPSKCDPTVGCVTTVRNCTQEMIEGGFLQACKVAGCSDLIRTGKAVIDGRQYDVVFPPGCYVDLSTAVNESDSCPKDENGNPKCPSFKEDECGVCNGDGSTCGIKLSIAEAAGIAAGALAGIIIACIVACVIISGIGGKVGMDYYRKYKGTMGPSHSNPLYQGKESGGTNPFYEEGAK